MKEKIKQFFSVWLVILILNQLFIFRGCFALYCLISALPHTGVLAFLWVKYIGGSADDTVKESESDLHSVESKQTKDAVKKSVDKLERERNEKYTKKPPKTDYLKEMGDNYERFIGAEFEKKGDLVIYNGFIKGYEDQGVDLVSISENSKTINLIQCKNWTKMRMSLSHMENVYSKLNNYNFDCLSFPSYQVDDYRIKHSKNDNTYAMLLKAKTELPEFTIRKTLFIASEKVVDLEVGPYLTMMTPTIFRYKDMKIVMKAN